MTGAFFIARKKSGKKKDALVLDAGEEPGQGAARSYPAVGVDYSSTALSASCGGISLNQLSSFCRSLSTPDFFSEEKGST